MGWLRNLFKGKKKPPVEPPKPPVDALDYASAEVRILATLENPEPPKPVDTGRTPQDPRWAGNPNGTQSMGTPYIEWPKVFGQRGEEAPEMPWNKPENHQGAYAFWSMPPPPPPSPPAGSLSIATAPDAGLSLVPEAGTLTLAPSEPT